jgi:thioredoxin-related protein
MNKMKKWIAFYLMTLCFVVNAQKINFREGTLSDILSQAKTENKPVMLMGYATWCPHCNKMKSEVITDAAVADFYNKNFVCIMQDMEAGEGISTRKKYSVKSYPAFLFLNPQGELLYSISAELTAESFIKEGQNALDPKKQFPYLKTEFEKDVSNAENCLAYISALRRSNLKTDAEARKYLATQTDAQLISATNWKIIANGIRSIDSREFQFVLKNQAPFAAVSSAKRVEKKIVNMVQETLDPYVEASDTIRYFKNRPAAAKIGMVKTDSLIYNYDLKILESAKNWKAYRKVTAESVPKFSWKNAKQLREISKNYMNYIDDKTAMEDAIAWTKHSLELGESYESQIILARLYLKTGDMKEAKSWGEKAKLMATNNKWNTEQADVILEQIK